MSSVCLKQNLDKKISSGIDIEKPFFALFLTFDLPTPESDFSLRPP